TSSSGLILETEFNRVGRRAAGTIISSQTLCRRGTRGLRALASAPGVLGEISFMRTVTEARFRRSPWGRKKHLLPLPILSVVLMVTAMASPGLLRMTVVVFDDSNLTISASIQNVVHPSGTSGMIVGIMRLTNHDSLANWITVA